MTDNGWSEYRREVMAKLDEQQNDIRALQKSVNELSNHVSALNVKAGVWGVTGGIVAGLAFRFLSGPK
jgi:hypothetical protein